MQRIRNTVAIAGCGVAIVVGLAACGGNQQEATRVTVSEWIVQPKPAKFGAGKVRITADNVGSRTHELIVYRGTRASLPLKPDGSVSERDAEANIVGEVAGIRPGTAKFKDFTLKAGDYTFFCNIVQQEAGGSISHFKEGMVRAVRVG